MGNGARYLLASDLLSEAVLLLLGGDELGRTQRGQQTPTVRTPRSAGSIGPRGSNDVTALVAALCRLRREHPALRRERFVAPGELRWLRPDSNGMTDGDWRTPGARAIAAVGAHGAVLVNGWWEPAPLPASRRWAHVGSRTRHGGTANGRRTASGSIELEGRSLVVLATQDSADD
jgi:glycogen operon protein